ncbi:pyridine nucleotide-disulfide oxidoreductase family protein [Cylindrospermum stagnale PCC 7417]|uniref:Pyridine nucleotide-disulfide oxidoreductase family protein n=1 Tax=Cylindrospermum stagnale PCC 7417 TaxID=56107 RepID=K9X5B3_9NOST|nr:FAD-dependent oxidoreductase [Cylindrospermum stagnale]AFZ27855.1 pyridine nucleotide-disulfide oxidoreductase family protein [Cylindrospermum stagnale PCC 7417]
MQQNLHPKIQNLVLIGGGHSHAIVLKMFGAKALSGVRLTLITADAHTPYSGMLPGHIAGFYSYDECHIDLQNLAKFAQAQLHIDQVVGLDLENNQVLCANGLAVDFDLLSIDIGSIPAKISVSGAAEYAIAAKPISQLLQHWYQLVEDVTKNPQESISIAIVGGGAGGVELSLAMMAKLQQILHQHQQPSTNLEIHLCQRTGELMPSYDQSVRRLMQQVLTRKGIKLHLGEAVCQIAPKIARGPRELFALKCESGLTVDCHQIFWVTQASAPEWLKAAGLGTDAQGFILVDDRLRSLTHPNIFAAGDIATMVNHPLPKAGVFAVRQGKPLFENLQRYLLGKSLKPYKPQKEYLSLIGTGDKKAICASQQRFAIATRGALTIPPHKLLWHWKDWIDRSFMERFQKIL